MRAVVSWLRGSLPVVVVVAVLLALMYPLALLLGMPLARERMGNVSNWVRGTVEALPVADATAGGERLPFGGAPEVDERLSSLERGTAVLVRDGRVVAAGVDLEDGAAVLSAPLEGPAVTLGARLEPLAAPAGSPGLAGRLHALPAGATAGAPLYLDGALLRRGSVAAVERADGVRREFTVPGAGRRDGDLPAVALVAGEAVLEGEGFALDGDTLLLDAPPAFNAPVSLVTGDYEYLDPAAGTLVVRAAVPAGAELRVAGSHVALVEGLVGPVDGENRTFRLQSTPVLETDPARVVYLGDRPLSGAAERPQERVDGARATFTFPSDRGIVTVDGREAVAGVDYERDGAAVTFRTPPPRNAALRQHPDYRVSDPATGTVTLAEAPRPGEALWAASYTFYAHPACGETAFECFLGMPQHPVPFPNWIAERLVPFLTAYPLSDPRNVVRATLYTAAGTLVSLAVGTVIGVLLAVAFVRVKPFEQALLPWVIASQTIPVIALVPVLVAVLGNLGVTVQTSLVPAAIVGAYIAFFPITVGTVTGLRSVDPLALDLMKAYAATPLQSFVKLRFPAAVPHLFTSLKLGAAAALVGALVAEVESNNRLGLGYAIIGQVQAGDVADVWILLGISALLGISLVALVGLLQRLLAPWQRTGLAADQGGR
ncbi:MAG TPA: ABC transporter permease subunit [Trueperaceae bacterium]|nr:ABC transporter permease subunit [Trueperaceae bacterium]